MRNISFKLSMWGIAALVVSHVVCLILVAMDPYTSVSIDAFLISLAIAVGFVWFGGWLTTKSSIAGGIIQCLLGLGLLFFILLGFLTSKGELSGDVVKAIYLYLSGPLICGILMLISAWLIFFRPTLITESRPPKGPQHIYGFPSPVTPDTKIEE